jgi:hypothetical protein
MRLSLIPADGTTRLWTASYDKLTRSRRMLVPQIVCLTAYGRSCSSGDLPSCLRAYAESQRRVYHEDWLGHLWERPGGTSAENFIARGWEECLARLVEKSLLIGTIHYRLLVLAAGKWTNPDAGNGSTLSRGAMVFSKHTTSALGYATTVQLGVCGNTAL